MTEQLSALAYRNFIETCRTLATRQVYVKALRYFMDYLHLSPEAYDRLLDQYQARNETKSSEDTLGSEDKYPHQTQIPSLENGENHAQNGDSEGSEGSDPEILLVDFFKLQ